MKLNLDCVLFRLMSNFIEFVLQSALRVAVLRQAFNLLSCLGLCYSRGTVWLLFCAFWCLVLLAP